MLNQKLHKPKCFSEPTLSEAKLGKSSTAYDESSIKLTDIVKCTDTMCTGALMATCYCYVANSEHQVWLLAFQLPWRVINVTTGSATVGFWHFPGLAHAIGCIL